MRARWAGTGVLAALALLPALSGCGGVGSSTAAENVGSQLTIYSSLPLQGPEGSISQQIVGGEKLALSDEQGHVGRFTVNYVSLDDSSHTTGEWDPGVTASNAKAAAQDPTTIAYLGDFNSGASAVSLPLTNAAGILQVSPASPYIGLTSSRDANQGEPERFYLTGKRTFGRIAPGDAVQAAAQVALLRRLAVHKLYLVADQDPFDTPLAALVQDDAEHAGIKVVGDDTVTIAPGSSFTGEVKKISEGGAQAVFVSATATEEAAELWRELHTAAPHLSLLASTTMNNSVFTSHLQGAESATFIGSPVLPIDLYPLSARRVLSEYGRHFATAGEAYALYGYEAMSVVLASIRAAGADGDDRQAVIDKFFATRERHSVLGLYSIQPNGETTLSTYAIDRLLNGTPVFWRAFDAAG
ncbi:MAG TPA: branched-chain amino acid ABC transporter substrate-binding protein [Solirubrobacteraceae bacterium]